MFNILILVFLGLIAASLFAWLITYVLKTKKEVQRAAILSHRELWLYYMNEPELAGILSNNNGTGKCTIDADKMTENQYRFLVLFLNHMEHMLPSYKKYEKDWIGLFKNTCLRRVYENTKLYRSKKFCKLIDVILESYKD